MLNLPAPHSLTLPFPSSTRPPPHHLTEVAFDPLSSCSPRFLCLWISLSTPSLNLKVRTSECTWIGFRIIVCTARKHANSGRKIRRTIAPSWNSANKQTRTCWDVYLSLDGFLSYPVLSLCVPWYIPYVLTSWRKGLRVGWDGASGIEGKIG